MLSSLSITFLSLLTLSHSLPLPSSSSSDSIINISHTSASTNKTTTQSIDPATISPDLAKVLSGSTINLNVVGEKRLKRELENIKLRGEKRKVRNSTINMTVVGRRSAVSDSTMIPSSPVSSNITARPVNSRVNISAAPTKSTKSIIGDHSILIDASSSSPSGNGGGIHNSTVNINLVHSKRKEIDLGHHSILVAPSSSDDDSATIDSTIMNINILPRRSTPDSTAATSIGHHSIVLSPSASSDDAAAAIDSTTMNINILPRRDIDHHSVLIGETADDKVESGHHSVVVSPKSSASSSAPAIKDSTINVTVVGGNKEGEITLE